ncbi:transporter [Rufibacter sp. DG15C]|uniref:transporter n=1 Tax=Rufibacter sp. DG15C TaxID=1379909 RepID=UPI0008325283|nr:transporter [Rufibacter sp. DG15C]
MSRIFTTVFITLLAYSLAFGQTQEADSLTAIETDRPDQTEAASLVPKGFLQLEAGYFRQVDKQEGYTLVSKLSPTVLVRYGLLEALELRLLVEHLQLKETTVGLGKVSGWGPVAVGTKIKISEEKGLLPAMAFIGHLTLRTGKSEFKPSYLVPDFRFSLAHTLSDYFSLGYNVGYEWAPDEALGQTIYTVALGAALSEKLGAFIEFFGQKPQDQKWQHQLDGGLTYKLLSNLQIDASAGLGLSKDAPDYFVSGGLSVRLPR